jgi:hypothetical protein
MGRTTLVGTFAWLLFAWLLLGAMAWPGVAQELSLPAAAPSLPQTVPPEDAVQPTEPATWSGLATAGGVILESIFGKSDPNAWRPLPLSTFFSEGWFEPWVPSPQGSGGAPRQGWINASEDNMYRACLFTFAQAFNEAPVKNAYLGSYTLLTPLSRRLELITNVPFVVVNNVSSGLPISDPPAGTAARTKGQATFGDVSFTPRVLLHETQDLSLTAEVAVLTPTGDSPLAGRTSLIPAVGFWNNFAGTWAIRGGLGVDIPLRGGGADTLISQFAIGQTLTAHDVPVIGDFTYYLATVVATPLSRGDRTSVTLTPGVRTHLGHNWSFLAGLPTPVTKERVADLGLIFWFMKAW